MLNSIWKLIAIPLGYIMRWCYLLVNDVLGLPLPYVWAMFLFAVVTTILLFPLSLRQQRSSAKMAAIQPLIQDIQKKFAKDKNRQQEEIQKLQQDLGYNPMSGCLPMFIQFPIMFGLVEVIYAPLTYMLQIPGDLIAGLKSIVEKLGVDPASRYIETSIIEKVKTNFDAFKDVAVVNLDYLTTIKDLNLSIGSINLWETPSFSNPSLLWLMPAFSIITMLISMLFSNKTSGATQSGNPGMGKVMMISMAVMFGIFSFKFPAGFSLYWGMRNIINIGQSAILRKIVDPDKIKAQIIAEYNEKKKKNKKKTTVKLVDEKTGEKVEKEMSATEIEKLRLQKAREIDERRYSEDDSLQTEEAPMNKKFDEEDKKTIDSKPQNSPKSKSKKKKK